MWMVGYNDGGGEFNMTADHSFNGRKLRPLIPRTPVPSSTNNITCSNSSPPTLSCLHGTTDHLFSLNHHLATMADQSKKEFHSQPVVVSSRWNPTPEQLRTLEELYRRGTRTPSAEQIQHITAQLRRYGKIEGKNVFYWFQNHKARERQKRRRQMESTLPDQHRDMENFERKDSGANRTGYEGHEQTKNWPPSTNCSTLPEESVSIQRGGGGGGAGKADGWIQFDEVEFHHRRSFIDNQRNATWQMMQVSCPSSAYNPINTSSTSITTTSFKTLTVRPESAVAAETTPTIFKTLDQKLIKYSPHDLNILLAPYANSFNNGHVISEEDDGINIGCGESQTLQLFPLRSTGDGGVGGGGVGDDESINDKQTETSAAMNANFSTPYQFFEFLPLKN